ncbi:MAG TPA: type 1 glutamine amidotransferase [Azospirillaceae bacterium]|nr:type 1 glutamine amidotransferase [Azospirillaceae bacterium]
MASLRILVADGNTRETNAAHAAVGGRPTGEHYVDVLQGLGVALECDIVHPADADAQVPRGAGLEAYDGLAWTGSALNVYRGGPTVEPQLALSRAAFACGLPQFGSCWGLQVGVTAAGGRVEANPRGRELGIARRVTPTPAGAGHPLFGRKRGVFDAIAVHMDEVAALPPGATVLAANSMSAVQAAVFRHGQGLFWGVQYHPEYDFNEIACVISRYGTRLVEEGFFADLVAQNRYVAELKTLHGNPDRRDLVWLHGLDRDVMEPALRRAELSAWLETVVRPHAARRGRG